MRFSTAFSLLAAVAPGLTCDNCYGPRDDSVHVRNVKRMQPGVQNATSLPRGPLAWGQLNVIHTTDTHGWLEGHIKEANYGADWGDYVSFTKHMQHMAGNLGVDLLLIDTGDLHDGNGDSDAESPDGSLTNPIFENVDYDLLTIGNHELYLSDVAYLTFNQFSKVYGDKYLTSNVQILNPATGAFEYIGAQYRYFTTAHGLRVMAYGVLYDFTGNANTTIVTKAAAMVKQSWFLNTVNFTQPIDLFMVIGHNPARSTTGGSTFGTIYKAIRAIRPDVPIQTFGGHTHIRDFAVYDQGTTGMESGRYCETLGWFSMSGIKSSSYTGLMNPRGVPNPTQKAVKVSKATATATSSLPTTTGNSSAFSNLVYFRRYLDWNRLTFAYHAVGSQSNTFDYHSGLRVTGDITNLRNELNLTALYGCAPQTYCESCKPFGTNGNILNLLEVALGATVMNQSRVTTPRLVIINSGSVRFDLVEGPFTYDDSFIVSPFTDAFQFIPNVPYNIASQVLAALNAGEAAKKRRNLHTQDFAFSSQGDSCLDAVTDSFEGKTSLLTPRSAPLTRGKHRRQTTSLTPGYTTTDDFGIDGDDTIHSAIPYYPQPEYIQGNGSFPAAGSAAPAVVDLVFLDFIADYVLAALAKAGAQYTEADINAYLPVTFTTNSYLPLYAKEYWQANVPNCPVGEGVGYGS
ncbi:hypothetical protein MMC14_000443 [Varicellaria rhodocarpa]|nr:hypothetical protein [Varicellaria rhodocarpa]